MLNLLARRGDIIQAKRNDILWHLDLREGIDLSIYLLGGFELKTYKTYQNLIKPGQTVIDIGANIGAYTLNFAKIVGNNGSVIAFEPTDYAFNKLKCNINLNPNLAKRIRSYKIMLGKENKSIMEDYVYSSWPVMDYEIHGVDKHPIHGGRLKSVRNVEMWKLDSFIKEKNINCVDFIKIDVDGYEADILEGSKNTLAKFKPIIGFEVAPYTLEEKGKSLMHILDYLIPLKYELFNANSRNKLPCDAELLSEIKGSSINVVAITERHIRQPRLK